MTGQRVLRRMVTIGPALCLVAGCLVFLGVTGASASPATYYVDSAATCPGSGTQASPWCNFSVVNSRIFQPGDQILLKDGDTFTSGMTLSGSGTSTSYLTVGAYGSGPAPIINGGNNLTFIGIDLYNNSYVQVEGVSVEDAGTGILINNTTSQTGYRFLNLYLSGDGLGIQSPGNAGAASNVLVQDVQGAGNTLLCGTGTCGGGTLNLGGASDVTVNRLFTSGGCSDADWSLGPGASNVVVENSESIGDGDCPSDLGGGTTANFIDQDTNVKYVNDIIAGIPNDGGVDMSALDVEPQDGPDNGINIEDNYIANNAGPGIEILDHPSPITNLNISGNVLSDNSIDHGTYPYNVWGQIWTDTFLPYTLEATGSIDNNLYNAPASTGGFEETNGGANLNAFSQSNNLDVSGNANVWYAANGFSCTTQGANGWSYQSSADNSIWTNLSSCSTVSTLDQEWTTGGTASGFVSNFEELPPSTPTSWAARSWTAPNSGGVSIRGRLLMSDPTCGSGVTAEITKNGSSNPLWGPQTINAGDGVGVDTNLDGISVNAGDVLHFAVQENGSSQCRVSWTPSVAIPNPVSTVIVPSAGAELTGTQVLDAAASDSASRISQVQFLLTGGSLNDAAIATGTPTYYGWLTNWASASVPNGTYTLQSVAYDAAGNVAYSPGVTIFVDNVGTGATPPTTTVLVPSKGSSVSGSQVLLDAGASDNVPVAKVQFHLTGGSLNNSLIATGTQTPYGWDAYWDSTTVPDGTYTLQSDAYDAAGNQGVSTAETVIVENSPPTTNIVVPSTGASVSGGQVVLDAEASARVGVNKVEFHLTGGSLNGALIATGTLTQYGWAAIWNSTTVPNGTYTLQSDAYTAGYQGFSTAVTVIVDNPPPTTSVLIPSSGASVSGGQVVLDAGASDSGGVTKVTYDLTGGSLNNALIATASPTYYGWLAQWNSTTVPNGTYTLQSDAYDAAGNEGVSDAVTVIVDNPPPTTSVLIPSNGGSLSGTQVLLDAGASDNGGVADVQFTLTGGSLNDAPIATATLSYYGWLAQWDSTTVPDGTYTLQSDAYDAAGNQGVSTAISVTVAN
jgi:Bacterial Ig domain